MQANKLVTIGMWMLLILGPYSMAAYGQASCALANGGQPLLPVIVSANANASVRESATELADYLGRITGGRFEIQVGDGATGIAVGMPNDFPALQSDQALHLAERFAVASDIYTIQSYVLRSHANGIAVIGGSELAVEYAVWDLLYKLGYRKFFPTVTWEVIPSLPNAALAVDVFEKPDYADRRIWYGFGGVVGQCDWNLRNRMIQASTTMNLRPSMPMYLKAGLINAPEGYDDIISVNQAEFDAHPEYYALVGGQRVVSSLSKLCLSNPNVQQMALSAARYRFDTNPDFYHFSYSMEPSDGGGWCECANCVAMGDQSERIAFLANFVATGLETTHPDKWVSILAYNEHADPPAINIHPRVWVQCAVGLSGPIPVQERLQDWREQGATVGAYDYWGIAQWGGYLPAMGYGFSYYVTSIPEYHKCGARVMSAESGENWGAKGLYYYIASRLLWSTNEAAQVQALTDDFMVKAFGPAAEAMRSFYALMDSDKNAETGGLPGSPDYWKNRYTQMYAALLWANDAAGADPAIQARLDDLFLYTRFVQLIDNWDRSGTAERQVALEQLVLFAYRIRETGMAHWNGMRSCIPGAAAVDLTPPPSCVTPALRAEARAEAVLVTANSPVHEPQANGLVAHWMLDETSGATASDSTGNGNAGTLIGDPVWTSSGKIGGALNFDGVNDYFNAGGNLNAGSNSWTVALWFKSGTTDGYLYGNGKYQALIGNGYFRYAWRPHWEDDGGTSFPVTIGQWYHATVVYDKANQYLYKDGVLIFSRAQTGDIGTTTESPLLLGACMNSQAPGGFFAGAMDDVRIYNKALTAAEVAALAAINRANHLPTAVNDAYTTAEDTPLTVAAPGVLGNDSDADGDALTAMKDIYPSNGKYGADHGLVLNANGAFTYTPRKDWNGTDSFTYKAKDAFGAVMQAVVTITVTPVNDAPTCSITNPVNGATFPAPASITINADALDVDGTVTKVEFFNGAAKLGEDTTSPYSYVWNNVAIGSYALTAKATDNNGAITTSAAVNVTVVQANALPTCSITSPTTGTAFIAPATITINASAADSDGSITKVEFYNGVVKLGEDATSPYSFAWNNVAVGGYALIAKATDNRGAVTTSAVVNVTAHNTIGTDGLVAHWMLDETYGTTAADSTGNGNSGTLIGGSTWTSDGKIGGALYLDGADDYVDIGDKLNPGSSDWSVALWFKSYAIGGYLYSKAGLYQASSGAGYSSYFHYAWMPNWDDNGGNNFPVTGGQWCHAVVVYDKANQYLYKNGILVYSRPQTGNIGSSAYHLLLGAANSDLPGGFFAGVLDDVRVYNKALTVTEVAVLASMGQANGAPLCYISTPANGTAFTTPATITINAIAADSDGSVTKVEFYNGSTKLGEDTSDPFSFVWNNVAAGNYALTARATDNSGKMTTSAVVNVTANVAEAGLVAHWALDETSGTTAADASGNGNTGSLIGGPAWTSSGKIGGALNFDGANDYVNIGDDLSAGTNCWTVALWFKSGAAGGFLYNNGKYQAYVGGGYFRYAWRPHWDDDGGTSFPVTAGQWYHATVVYDKINQYLYKDGVLVYSRAQTGDIGESSDYQLLLGACNSQSPGGFFEGAMDDVRIYNRALTAAEVAILAGTSQQNTSPTCSISSPANGATFTAPALITINANASDTDGSITKVEFYNGTVKLGEDLTSPYSNVWNNVTVGSYALSVVATDNGGAMTTSAVVNVTVNNADGLVAHWMLDETSGTTAADASGSGNAGTLIGGPVWTSSGSVGGALNFDGANDYVNIGDDLSAGTNCWTVALWFKSGAAGGYLYGNGKYQAYVGGGYFRYAWRPHWEDDGGTSFPVTAGQWYHATVVYDKINQYLYKDGALVYSRAQTGDIGEASDYQLLLGSCNSQTPGGFFEGAMDDVRIYNRALTATEVAELADMGEQERMIPENIAPTCSISSPANGVTFTAPASITVNANASDSDGTIAKVEFYNGVMKMGEDLTSPYNLVTNGVTAGSYTLTVRATDDDGAITTSAVANVTVNPPANVPPTCSITNPLNGATFSAPASITINAIASDSDGTVTKVEFYNGAVKMGEDLSSPYSLVTNGVVAGSYALTVRATDNSGTITTSAVANVTVVGLPSPWTAQNIGAVGLAGDTIYNSGTFTNKGAGTNIAGTVDAFRYVQQVTSGDCELKLRVASVSNTSSRAKAGVMLRGSLTANAMEAGVWVTPSSGIVFTYRTSNGGSTTTSTSSGKVAPYWVRITRTSNSFKAYYSSNGTSWTQLGSTRTISMPTSAYMGLATCSGNTNMLCISAMDNVTATP